MPHKHNIALVVQRYGAEVTGGSEHLCRIIANELAPRHGVQVITTTALDYMTWDHHYAEGVSMVEGISVRRFRVDKPRNVEQFNKTSEEVYRGSSREREMAWMRQQGPYSSGLLKYLREHGRDHDLYIFLTYLYCTTFFGLPLVKERAVLIPTAHDEPAVYLNIFDELFSAARHCLFLTPEEQEFVLRRFHLDNGVGELLPVGVAPPVEFADDRELPLHVGGHPYLVYVGRVDASKGCVEMIEHFIRLYDDLDRPELRLVMVGKEAGPMPRHPAVLPLGYQPEGVKNALLRRALAAIAPSPYESLCIAAIEAWYSAIPVIANARCEVLKGQCRRTQGGFTYSCYEEFRDACLRLMRDKDLCGKLGANGQRYVEQQYSPLQIQEQYGKLIKRFVS